MYKIEFFQGNVYDDYREKLVKYLSNKPEGYILTPKEFKEFILYNYKGTYDDGYITFKDEKHYTWFILSIK